MKKFTANQKSDLLTCAGAADDAVVYNGTAVDGDLQTVMSVVMLSRFIIRIKLQHTSRTMMSCITSHYTSHESAFNLASQMKQTYLYGHVAYVRVLRALHEHKRRVSSVLDKYFICDFTRSCRRKRVITTQIIHILLNI